MQLANFLQIYLCAGFDWCIHQILLLKLIYMYVKRWCMSEMISLIKKIVLVTANLCNMHFYANILVRTVLTDLLDRLHHVNSCINCQLLRLITISHTVMCTLHDFLSSKVRFIDTSTVTGSHSCSGKNYAYTSRTSCFMFILSLPILLVS